MLLMTNTNTTQLELPFAHPTTQGRKVYLIQTSSAHMPNSCWGVYRNVAILEVDSILRRHVSMISDHARGVVEVYRHLGHHHVGSTARCAYQRALAEAERILDRLEAEGHLVVRDN